MKHMASDTGIVSAAERRNLILYLDADNAASKVAGTPFAEYMRTGDLGRFLGFLACLIQASFTIAGTLSTAYKRRCCMSDA